MPPPPGLAGTNSPPDSGTKPDSQSDDTDTAYESEYSDIKEEEIATFVEVHLNAIVASVRRGRENTGVVPHDGWVYAVQAEGPHGADDIRELLCAIFRNQEISSLARFVLRFSTMPGCPNSLIVQRPSVLVNKVLGFADEMAEKLSEVFSAGTSTSIVALEPVYEIEPAAAYPRRRDLAFAALHHGQAPAPRLIFEVLYENCHYTPAQIAHKHMEDSNWEARTVIVFKLSYPGVIPATISAFRQANDSHAAGKMPCLCPRKVVPLAGMDDRLYIDEDGEPIGGILQFAGKLEDSYADTHGEESIPDENEHVLIFNFNLFAEHTLNAVAFLNGER